MTDLLRLEFRRLFRAKSFYICLVIALAMIVISAAATKMLLNMAAASKEYAGVAEAAALQLPTSFSMLKSVPSSSLTTILAIFISIFVTEDYSSDIIKNVYSKGNSRDEVFFSKCISTFVAGLMMILVCALFSFAMGKALFGKVGTMGKNYVGSLSAELVVLLAYVAIYFAVAISVKKTGASIAASIIGPLLVGLLLTLGNAALKSDKISLSDYWLEGRLTILSQADVAWKEVWIGFLVGAVVLVAAGAIGFFVNRTSEK